MDRREVGWWHDSRMLGHPYWLSQIGVILGLLAVTSLAAQPRPRADCIHEPRGVVRVSDDSFAQRPPDGPNKSPSGWSVVAGRRKIAVVADRTAPTGDGLVLAGLFRAGDPGGRGPFRIELLFPQMANSVYQCFWFKHSKNFTDNRNVGTKFGFLLGAANGGTNHYFGFHGGREDFFIPVVALQFMGGSPANQGDLFQARQSGQRYRAVPLDVWREYEVLVEGNAPRASDGAVFMWIDGQPVVTRTGLTIFIPGKPRGFQGITWNPTYGGGLNPVPFDMYTFVDRWLVSIRQSEGQSRD